MIERLPLDLPEPADLARGVELTALMAIERATDCQPWHSLLEALRKDGVNGSWSRSALLGLVRSEISSEVLEKASAQLLADRGRFGLFDGCLLKLGVGVPASAIPDVVDLFTAWSIALAGKDHWTPYLVPWLHYWLTVDA